MQRRVGLLLTSDNRSGVSYLCGKKCPTTISDNIGGVKQLLSTLQHALGKEHQFALAEKVPYPIKAHS